jgi:hypothetical protein
MQQPEKCGGMCICIKDRLVVVSIVVLVLFFASGCVKHKSDAEIRVKILSTSSGNEIARKWIVGLWKESGSSPLNGPPNTYSWGESKFDEAALSIDLSPTQSIISTYGIERIVDNYKQDRGAFLFYLKDASGHVQETLSVNIEADGTISFPINAQRSTLSIAFMKKYHKVDGPYRDWSAMK